MDAGTVELSRGRRVLVRSDVKRGEVVIDTGGIGHPRELVHKALSEAEALLEAIPDGSFVVQVLEDGVPVCELDEEREEGDIAVRCNRGTVSVSGRVAIGEQPGDGMLVWRQKSRAALPEGGLTTRGVPLPSTQVVSNRPREREAMLDGEGRYRADGRWVFSPWQDLRRALDEGVELDPYESASTLVLAGESPETRVEVIGPGDWNLGALRIWFGGAMVFRVGEAIPHLPVGSYTVRWNDRSRTVHTERGRTVEVEIDG